MRHKEVILVVLVALLPAVLAAAPQVEQPSLPSSINLLEGTTKEVVCNATIMDLDGFGDIVLANATLFDAAVTSVGGADDENEHYTNQSCALIGGSGNSTTASCAFSLQYFSNPSSQWTCQVRGFDGNITSANTSASVTVNELKAISVSNLDYGELGLGAVSSATLMNITNTGNTNVSIEVSSTGPEALSCSIGSVSLDDERYKSQPNPVFNGMTPITQNATQVSNLTISKRTGSDDTYGELWWRIQLGQNGTGGSCSGGILVNAI